MATRRELRLAGLAAWGLGALLLALQLAPSGHHAVLAVAAVVGVAVAAAGGVVLRRRPWLLAFLTLLLIPARIPVSVGSTDAMLLVPLYLVVGAAAAALALALWRGEGPAGRELGPVALPLAAFIAWTGLSLSWTNDLDKGSVQLLFFFLPFGLLALALARLPWRERLVGRLALQLAAMGVLFALVGIGQYAARHVFWNPKVIVGNAYQPFFRVNSLFWDPSVYGRFLVVAALAGLVVAVWGPAGRVRLLAAGGIALTWVGLLFSFSQSSFSALLVGLVVAGAVLLRPRAGAAVAGGAALLAAVALAAGWPGPGSSQAAPARAAAPAAPAALVLADATSGRGKLVREGIQIAIHHPVWGVGIGGFIRAYADRVGMKGRSPKTAASHTTPVTVAAEGGIVGLALLAWLAVVALAVPFRNAGRSMRGRLSLGLGLILLAISVHSLGYNALFEDPTTWGALGLAACAARAGREGEGAEGGAEAGATAGGEVPA